MAATDEAGLLARAGRGDRAAFREFHDQLSTPLHSLALRMAGNASDAEDLLQETFVKIWRHAPNYDPRKSKPFTWAVTIMRRTCIDHQRHRRSRPVTEPWPEGPAGAMEPAVEETVRGQAERAEAVQNVRAALGHFAEPRRQALELALFSGLTHIEISQRLGQPAGTVKSWIRRGLLNLRETLTESGP
ncbi:MAG TPA: sigma-70 family RNA polymerase sigma factor [Candidatus Didemnitutus sp.]